MRKTSLYIGLSILIITLLASCGGEKKEKQISVIVKPKTTAIKGDLGEYFEVVNKEYQINKNDMFNVISVEVKRNEKAFSFSTEKLNPFGVNDNEAYHVGFGIELYSNKGAEMIKNATGDGFSGPYNPEDVMSLMKLKSNEIGIIRWSVNKIEELVDFEITSAIEKSNNSSLSNENQLNEGDVDFEKFISGYEKFANKYLAFSEKFKKNPNDPSLTMLLTEITTEASEWALKQTDFNNCSNPNYINRLLKVQAKLSKAAVNMSN